MVKVVYPIALILLAMFLTSCSDQESPTFFELPGATFEAPMPPAMKEAFLSGYHLYGPNGMTEIPGEPQSGPNPELGTPLTPQDTEVGHPKLQAPLDPATKTSPFGVLLRMLSSGKVFSCTSVHLRPGIVLTNAHCVLGHKSLGPEGFAVLYFDKQGREKRTNVLGFKYVGSLKLDDIAIMTIPDEAALEWDVANGKISALTETREVTVWAFNPTSRGMIFSPRKCLASGKLPKLEGVSQTGERSNLLNHTEAKESVHIFIDRCDDSLRGGNSGALVSAAGNLSEIFGIYHWGIKATPNSLARYSHFEYSGNDGQLQTLTQQLDQEIFGVGSVLVNFF